MFPLGVGAESSPDQWKEHLKPTLSQTEIGTVTGISMCESFRCIAVKSLTCCINGLSSASLRSLESTSSLVQGSCTWRSA